MTPDLGMDLATALAALGSGGVVGVVLGLVGGGGSILAVPLLVYAVGVGSAHVAIGTGAIAVAMSAAGNLPPHWRRGRVKWRCGTVFAGVGAGASLAGAAVAQAVDGDRLLVLFGGLMVAVGLLMLRRRDARGDPGVRLTPATARTLLPPLVAIGAGVGLLSGFFGIGGGFLAVPALILATGMPLASAVGTSLIAVAAFGAATAASYASAGLVDWPVAAAFVAGGLGGGPVGARLGTILAGRGPALATAFAGLVIAVGLYVVAQGLDTLAGAADLRAREVTDHG